MTGADPAPKKKPYHAALVAAFATGATVSEAAESAHVSTSTAKRWNARPENRREVETARGEVIRSVLGRLAKHATSAVDTLAVLLDAEHAAGVRCRAATALLDVLLRGREHVELSDRIEGIEAALAARGEP